MTSGPSLERVLQVHTRYREAGGEDAVVAAERHLLEAAGLAVEQVIFDNADLREAMTPVGDLRLAANAVWSRSAGRRIRGVLRNFRPQVMHVHNTFAAASPSVYHAAFELGVPVVQTLHNYRYVCPAATAFRDGHACTDCLGRVVPWPGVLHACVRDSRAQSLVAAATSSFHAVRGTYRREVDCFLVLTEFQRRLLVAGGLPSRKVRIVENSLVEDPGVGDGDRHGVLFVGRLSIEKGIAPLIDAARQAPGKLTVVGDGPMRPLVERAGRDGWLNYRGPLSKAAVLDALRAAVAVVCPSLWFEGMPMVILEAYATATPVIASRIGSLEDLVDDGRTGTLIPAGNPDALADSIEWALGHAEEMRSMGRAARRRYDARYAPERHLHALLETYIAVRRGRPAGH